MSKRIFTKEGILTYLKVKLKNQIEFNNHLEQYYPKETNDVGLGRVYELQDLINFLDDVNEE